MPTTRNRWQSELQLDAVQKTRPRYVATAAKPKQSEPAVDSTKLVKQTSRTRIPVIPVNTSADEDVQDDLDSRSPKRRRVASANDADKGEVLEPQLERVESGQPSRMLDTSTRADTSNIAQNGDDRQNSAHGLPHQVQPTTVSLRTRLDNLAVLNNLASQLLAVLAKMTPSEALQLASNPSSNTARDYGMVRTMFEPVRRLYYTHSPFLSPTMLSLTDPAQVDALRKANQAIFMSSIFTGEIGLRDMDQNFLNVFVPENGRLLKAQGSIYLELKTQAFITARRTGAAEPLVVIDDLFLKDMERRLLDNRPGAKALAPSEQDFLKRLSSRRDILLADVKSNTLDELPVRYRWEDFSREVSAYLARNFDGSNPPARVTSPETPASNGANMVAPPPQGQMEGQFSIHALPLPDPVPGHLDRVPSATANPPTASSTSFLDDFVAQAARAAEIAMQGPSENLQTPKPSSPVHAEPMQYTQVQPTFQHYNPGSSNPSGTRLSPFPGSEGEIPHSSQTAPTQVLYERARLVATAKSTPATRKLSTPSQRRAWSSEEENALMTGLDRVKGPHWSQILAMYGPGGTVNESLKDRNQVQLKDKARNLKLFFLKSGIEVPYYLKYVTGDLKTRAPAHTSKQEAKEREKLQNDESRAHFDGLQGIMALAGGHSGPGGSSQSPALSASLEQEFPEESADTAIDAEFDVDMTDVEAMIARAAAEASQSLSAPGWNA